MMKEELLHLTEVAYMEERIVRDMTTKKIDEFMQAQRELLIQLRKKIANYFPAEIAQLVNEYVKETHRKMVVNELWISTKNNGEVYVELNPNHHANVSMYPSETREYIAQANDMPTLKQAYSKYEEYVLLKNLLEKHIEEIYEVLADFKTQKWEKDMAYLNSLSFPVDEKNKKYFVAVTDMAVYEVEAETLEKAKEQAWDWFNERKPTFYASKV